MIALSLGAVAVAALLAVWPAATEPTRAAPMYETASGLLLIAGLVGLGSRLAFLGL